MSAPASLHRPDWRQVFDEFYANHVGKDGKKLRYTTVFNPAIEEFIDSPEVPLPWRVLAYHWRHAWGHSSDKPIDKIEGESLRQKDIAEAFAVDKRRISEAVAFLRTLGYLALDEDGEAYPVDDPKKAKQLKAANGYQSPEFKEFLAELPALMEDFCTGLDEEKKVRTLADFSEFESAEALVNRCKTVRLGWYKQWKRYRTNGGASLIQQDNSSSTVSSSLVDAATSNETAVVTGQPTDDEFLFSDTAPRPKTVAEMVEWGRGLLRVARYGDDAQKSMPPDVTITTRILGTFRDVRDFEAWVTDASIQRALARKSNSPSWGLWETDAQNRSVDIGEVRIAREKAEEEARARHAEHRAAAAAEEVELRNLRVTPVPFDEALKVLGQVKIPVTLETQLRRTGEWISPNTLAQRAREWRKCPECSDRGEVGKALTRTLRFCDCPAGEEKRYADPGFPEREMAAVNSSLQKRMQAAAYELRLDFLGDAIGGASEVLDDGQKVSILTSDRLAIRHLEDTGDIQKVLGLLGMARNA